ncbi:hypothetical protein ABZ357_25460 [Streptomyces sp. NPDC005917]|uniref:hypothetical protein n=1 Tax=unclassified Streptomyces TaxID=2593676 RepID=UPI003409E7BB
MSQGAVGDNAEFAAARAGHLYRSGSQQTAATRTTPALTMKQLRAIALSPEWRS